MDTIDVIFYINLESRTDRKEHFLTEIPKLCNDPSKLVRVDAVYHHLGMLGCSLSHIKALELFETNPSWNTCIIFEDDFTFHNDSISENNAQLSTFFKEFPNWDVLSLSSNPSGLQSIPTKIPIIHKVIKVGTASGYCINKSFLPILKKNFIESSSMLTLHGKSHTNALDVHWKQIQPTANWYTIMPSVGYQYANYSDIEKQDVNYKC